MSKPKPLKGYICGTDILELNWGASDVKLFASIHMLKKYRPCWQECGIVEFIIKPKVVVKARNGEKNAK